MRPSELFDLHRPLLDSLTREEKDAVDEFLYIKHDITTAGMLFRFSGHASGSDNDEEEEEEKPVPTLESLSEKQLEYAQLQNLAALLDGSLSDVRLASNCLIYSGLPVEPATIYKGKTLTQIAIERGTRSVFVGLQKQIRWNINDFIAQENKERERIERETGVEQLTFLPELGPIISSYVYDLNSESSYRHLDSNLSE